MSNIMYRNARAEDGTSIAINEIDTRNRKRHGTLTCFGCGHEMIPAMGTKMEHHFRHKASNEAPCGFETYLHKMTKTRVFEVLREFQKENWDLLLRERSKKTIIVTDSYGVEAFREKAKNDISVLKGATKVELEQWHEGVRPDILVSLDNGNSVYFEIAVTHKCEDAKVERGIPIIELSVMTEEDADRLIEIMEQALIEEDGERIVSYNFPVAIEEMVDHERAVGHLIRVAKEARRAAEEAAHRARKDEIQDRLNPGSRSSWTRDYAAILTRKGHVVVGDPDEILSRGAMVAKRLEVPFEVNALQAMDAFAQFLQFKARKQPRTCLLCVRHSFAFIRRSGPPDHKSIYCKKNGVKCRPHEAGNCRSFYPLKTMEELVKYRENLAANPRAGDEAIEMVPPREGWFEVS